MRNIYLLASLTVIFSFVSITLSSVGFIWFDSPILLKIVITSFVLLVANLIVLISLDKYV